MPTLVVDTHVSASRERCFDLARDVQVHCMTASFTRERVLPPGRVEGLLGLGDLVVFEAVHLGVRQRLSARVTAMEPPLAFEDTMVSGAFSSLHHRHEFHVVGVGTRMRDILSWTSPLGPIGRLADLVVVGRHLRHFLVRKNAAFSVLAEKA